jgi:hypothetical protein
MFSAFIETILFVSVFRFKTTENYFFYFMFYPVLWIRIRKDPYHFGNLGLHPAPNQNNYTQTLPERPQRSHWKYHHKNKNKIYKLDPERDPDSHQFADVTPKCMEYEHFFKDLSLLFEARI